MQGRAISAALMCFAAAVTASHAWAEPMATPGLAGPLKANPDPYHFDGGALGDVYVTGAVTGFGMWQDNRIAGDHDTRLDLTNGQVIAQTIKGPVQFYVQGGVYSLPSLGAAYLPMHDATDDFFGPVPVAYVKFAPTDNFSIQAGKLLTLIGAENTFTFQNVNIERGLLWNQTNAVNRGIQLNYADGPFSGSVALSDGFYSGEVTNWLSGLFSYAIDENNSVTLVTSGSIKSDSEATTATPLFQNNSQIYDLIYTHVSGPWTISPVLQFTHVPEDVSIGIADSASTYGAAITTKYTLNDEWNLGGRVEYINSTGGISLVNGPGSNAWSATITPTWQNGIYFARGEASWVRANDTAPGAAFGPAGNDNSQARLLIEAGVLF